MVPATARYQRRIVLQWFEEEEVCLLLIQTVSLEDLRIVEAGENGQLDSTNQSSGSALRNVYEEGLTGFWLMESSHDLKGLALHQCG